jgi:NADH:ubiquinone oxidoreductase subunit 6 (subunit J)
MRVVKNDILFWTGISTAIWFAMTGMVWVYWGALIVAYPIGLISLLIWIKIKTENRQRTKYIPIILTVGLFLSISALIYLIIFD